MQALRPVILFSFRKLGRGADLQDRLKSVSTPRLSGRRPPSPEQLAHTPPNESRPNVKIQAAAFDLPRSVGETGAFAPRPNGPPTSVIQTRRPSFFA